MSIMPPRLATDFLENPVRFAEAPTLPVLARFATGLPLAPIEDNNG